MFKNIFKIIHNLCSKYLAREVNDIESHQQTILGNQFSQGFTIDVVRNNIGELSYGAMGVQSLMGALKHIYKLSKDLYSNHDHSGSDYLMQLVHQIGNFFCLIQGKRLKELFGSYGADSEVMFTSFISFLSAPTRSIFDDLNNLDEIEELIDELEAIEVSHPIDEVIKLSGSGIKQNILQYCRARGIELTSVDISVGNYFLLGVSQYIQRHDCFPGSQSSLSWENPHQSVSQSSSSWENPHQSVSQSSSSWENPHQSQQHDRNQKTRIMNYAENIGIALKKKVLLIDVEALFIEVEQGACIGSKQLNLITILSIQLVRTTLYELLVVSADPRQQFLLAIFKKIESPLVYTSETTLDLNYEEFSTSSLMGALKHIYKLSKDLYSNHDHSGSDYLMQLVHQIGNFFCLIQEKRLKELFVSDGADSEVMFTSFISFLSEPTRSIFDDLNDLDDIEELIDELEAIEVSSQDSSLDWV